MRENQGERVEGLSKAAEFAFFGRGMASAGVSGKAWAGLPYILLLQVFRCIYSITFFSCDFSHAMYVPFSNLSWLQCVLFFGCTIACALSMSFVLWVTTLMLPRPIVPILGRPNPRCDCHTLVNLHRPTIIPSLPLPCNGPQAWLTTWPRLLDPWTLPPFTIRLYTRSKFACVFLISPVTMPKGRLSKLKEKHCHAHAVSDVPTHMCTSNSVYFDMKRAPLSCDQIASWSVEHLPVHCPSPGLVGRRWQGRWYCDRLSWQWFLQ